MKDPAYSTRLDDALAFAASEFRFKHRKATPVPYLTHLLSVAAMVGEHGGDEDQIIAALLHDWLEDIPGATVEVLVTRWGQRVADMVVALSDVVDEHPKPPWKDRKLRYLALLESKGPDVRLISAADKLHNCRSIVRDLVEQGEVVFESFNAGKAGTLWYYRAVCDALGDGWSHPLLDELDACVVELENATSA